MAFMRVPSLEEEFGRDAAMGLNSLGWGKELLGRALGRDAEGRLVSSGEGVSDVLTRLQEGGRPRTCLTLLIA